MKSKLYLFLVFALVFQSGFSQNIDEAKSAQDILSSAKKIAAKEGKNIFIMWHASWCGYCKKMDKLMNEISVKQYFDDSFVIEHLVVKENKDLKHLENPGAEVMLLKYNGDKSGIPFWVILDSKGEFLDDSFMRPDGVGYDQPGKNTGCPLMQNEVDHWIKVLKKTTDISEEGLDKIKNKFLKK